MYGCELCKTLFKASILFSLLIPTKAVAKRTEPQSSFCWPLHLFQQACPLVPSAQPAVNKGSDRKKEGSRRDRARPFSASCRASGNLFLNVAHGHVQVSARITGIQIENHASFRNVRSYCHNASCGDGYGIMSRDERGSRSRGRAVASVMGLCRLPMAAK